MALPQAACVGQPPVPHCRRARGCGRGVGEVPLSDRGSPQGRGSRQGLLAPVFFSELLATYLETHSLAPGTQKDDARLGLGTTGCSKTPECVKFAEREEALPEPQPLAAPVQPLKLRSSPSPKFQSHQEKVELAQEERLPPIPVESSSGDKWPSSPGRRSRPRRAGRNTWPCQPRPRAAAATQAPRALASPR